MKTIFTTMISLCLISMINAQETVQISDFDSLQNSSWEGSLMYINYSDGKEVTLETTMKINIKKNTIICDIKFPKEPKANSKNKIKIRKKGTYFGDEKIVSKQSLANGFTKIITFYKGTDNNKKANMFNIYLFDKNLFSITKKVEYLNSEETIIRNKQTYKRI